MFCIIDWEIKIKKERLCLFLFLFLLLKRKALNDGVGICFTTKLKYITRPYGINVKCITFYRFFIKFFPTNYEHFFFSKHCYRGTVFCKRLHHIFTLISYQSGVLNILSPNLMEIKCDLSIFGKNILILVFVGIIET